MDHRTVRRLSLALAVFVGVLFIPALIIAQDIPSIPHPLEGRENCLACHTGPAAREEIRTSHPERERCQQCHVPSTTSDTFQSVAGQNE